MVKAKKVVTVYTNLTSSSDWTQNLQVYIEPDEVIIRQISYAGEHTDIPGVYFIWSDLINDYIGSFAITNSDDEGMFFGINVNPQTTFLLMNPTATNNTTRFQIYTISSSGTLEPSSDIGGELSMTMEFIKHKN